MAFLPERGLSPMVPVCADSEVMIRSETEEPQPISKEALRLPL